MYLAKEKLPISLYWWQYCRIVYNTLNAKHAGWAYIWMRQKQWIINLLGVRNTLDLIRYQFMVDLLQKEEEYFPSMSVILTQTPYLPAK